MLRSNGFDIEEQELQTAPRAAARVLARRRVLALTMSAIVEDLKGIELVGESADAVLLGGADEYSAGVHATVLGKPSSSFFAAALETLDSDPGQALVVGDDLASDIRGAQLHGMRTALVRTGKFRPDVYERSGIRPTVLLSSIADLPEWLATLR